ncbi:MAG: 30S ribosomal protein S20 [Armatimonadota bacterium]|nr:30S ribosomal protein S20 [Armatimonadota bacterium]MDR7439754.1 30S ribosomal protein S20 [Armatimonadota bacterium]MDR7562285.1 30S ribosomal protein S20 [Armatimonadota bacterium]MDR7568186.1 30S ribosomal protein S20 [Armatimonadota bacterium]MDR7602885.1 30S ribosomal protein S20 [Armatimonadota bacterium]
MAKRTPSALKRQRQTLKRTLRNRAWRSRIRTLIKKARELGTPEAVQQAIRAIDKAAAKGIIHRNTAARRKSRLMQAVQKALRAAAS